MGAEPVYTKMAIFVVRMGPAFRTIIVSIMEEALAAAYHFAIEAPGHCRWFALDTEVAKNARTASIVLTFVSVRTSTMDFARPASKEFSLKTQGA